ncbi:MAG: hypothetical protein LBU43_11100 [Candidatus Accumulibacter sp.]|jgi:hypothetical protein|nr:hypothetical protein [Accumulibacter sp.]
MEPGQRHQRHTNIRFPPDPEPIKKIFAKIASQVPDFEQIRKVETMEITRMKFDTKTIRVTQTGPDGESVTRYVALDEDQSLTVVFMEKCKRAGFGMSETWNEICLALQTIFKLGFIPADDELYELTSEQYQKFYAEMGKIDGKIYMLLPKNTKYQSTSKEVGVITEQQLDWLDKAKKVIRQYCHDEKKKFKNSEDRLAWLIGVLPVAFSGGTKVRRDSIRLV